MGLIGILCLLGPSSVYAYHTAAPLRFREGALLVIRKKKSQPGDKPGPVSAPGRGSACHLSARTVARTLHRSTLRRSALRHTRAGNPRGVGLRELSAPDVYGPRVTTRPVGSYPTFSPLPGKIKACRLAELYTLTGRSFSSTLIHSREQLPVRKRDALCCPDFPPVPPTPLLQGRAHAASCRTGSIKWRQKYEKNPSDVHANGKKVVFLYY